MFSGTATGEILQSYVVYKAIDQVPATTAPKVSGLMLSALTIGFALLFCLGLGEKKVLKLL